MAQQLIIDTHMHLYRRAEDGLASKEGYSIWEYGQPVQPVHFANHSGDPDSAREAMRAAGCRVAVVTNLHDVRYPGVSVAEDMMAFNRWLLDLAASDDRFYPLMAVDPLAMSINDNVAHLHDMVALGAKGIKVHPPVQEMDVGDPAVWPLFDACIEDDLIVVTHSGPSRDGTGRGTPDSFRPLLEAKPDLRIVLAHMGGQAWSQVPALARDYPQVTFDLCEIVEWLGASDAPTAAEFVDVLQQVGTDRIMMGSDFPWYDIQHTVNVVQELPGLSDLDRDRILGLNAARVFRIDAPLPAGA